MGYKGVFISRTCFPDEIWLEIQNVNSKCIHENINVSVPKSVTSESEGEIMHGGADPENVAGGAPKGSTLVDSKVPPAEPQDGSIMGLIQGKSDIDLNGVLLNEDQVVSYWGYLKGKN